MLSVSVTVVFVDLTIIYGCQAAQLGQSLLLGQQMSRKPDISTSHQNICAVASEQFDGDSRKPQGILGCGSNISCCVTPGMDGLEGISLRF